MKRRSRANPPRLPWTPEEESKLIEIASIGLDSAFWHLALPNRRFGEIADRRLELREAGLISYPRPI